MPKKTNAFLSAKNNLFAPKDLTVMICSWNRLELIPDLFDRLAKQTFDGCFEVLLWNNNYEHRETLDQAVADADPSLDIRVIHSTINYYCMPRLSAPGLMRSEQLLICDDDVLPEPGYVQRFIDAGRQYGERAVIGATGDVFRQQSSAKKCLQIWNKPGERVSFREEADDARVHFLHANNLLISRRLLSQVASFSLPHPDFALVDDYWMSFVLDYYLGVSLVAVRCDDVMQFHPSSIDPDIALWMNREVIQRKLAFTKWHSNQGWPLYAESWESPPVAP